MSKVYKATEGGFFEYLIDCPGCKCLHGIRTASWPKPKGLSDEDSKLFDENKWTFNEDYNKPTFHPSLHVHRTKTEAKEKETMCHSFIHNGMIQFLADCPHKLKNQTVELPDIEL